MSAGDATRLIFGMDSYGMQCGAINTFKNSTIDLRDYKEKYYLNPLDLLSLTNIPYAKSVCVKQCPSVADICNASSLPCTKANQYM
jgi:choline transporter-like protein 2/4/5